MLFLGAVLPSERVRGRLQSLIDRDVWSQRELAKRVGKSQPWLQKILSGENSLRLDDIDAMAAACRVPPAELIRDADNEIVEVTPSELRALRRIRELEPEQVAHILAILEMAQGKIAASVKRRQNPTGISTQTYTGGQHDRSIPAGTAAAELAELRAYLTRLIVDLGAASAGQIPDRPLPSARPDEPKAGGMAD